jgi:hypothetical protein
MEVVNLAALPLYPRGKSSLHPLYRRLAVPQSRSRRRGEEKIIYSTGTRTPTLRSSTPSATLHCNRLYGSVSTGTCCRCLLLALQTQYSGPAFTELSCQPQPQALPFRARCSWNYCHLLDDAAEWCEGVSPTPLGMACPLGQRSRPIKDPLPLQVSCLPF